MYINHILYKPNMKKGYLKMNWIWVSNISQKKTLLWLKTLLVQLIDPGSSTCPLRSNSSRWHSEFTENACFLKWTFIDTFLTPWNLGILCIMYFLCVEFHHSWDERGQSLFGLNLTSSGENSRDAIFHMTLITYISKNFSMKFVNNLNNLERASSAVYSHRQTLLECKANSS